MSSDAGYMRRYRARNRQRFRQYQRDYRKRRPRIVKAADLRSRHGISLDEYERLVRIQRNVCAICGEPEKRKGNHGKTKNLAVDHDHKTGRVRQLLCADCNTALGLLQDDPTRAYALFEYALKWL